MPNTPYSGYRRYAFCIPTAITIYSRSTGDKRVVCGWNPGTGDGRGELPDAVVDRLGSEVSNEDMRARLTRLLIAIEKTIRFDAIRRCSTVPGSTLRIFLAPEFYFRTTVQEQARGRDYTKIEHGQLLSALSFYFINYAELHPTLPPLRDWIFMLGTCVHRDEKDQIGFLVNEMVTIYINPLGGISIKPIRKMFTSKIDGILPIEDWNCRATGRQRSEWAMVCHHVLGPLGLSVEICLEHASAMANVTQSADVCGTVLSAAGMPYQDDEILAPNRRYFRVDGMLAYSYKEMLDSFVTDAMGRIPADRRRRATVGSPCVVMSPWAPFDPNTMGFPGYEIVGNPDIFPTVFECD